METEMERLKRNTEEQKVKQVHSELAAYIHELDLEIADRERWHGRSRNLELIMLFVHFSTIIALAVQDVSYESYGWITDVSFLVWMITMIRSSVIHTQVLAAVREQIGIIKTLRIMGMIKGDDDIGTKRKKEVKKWNPFSRYKEFWERITEKQTQEQYA